jgi:hypothetical protein
VMWYLASSISSAATLELIDQQPDAAASMEQGGVFYYCS